MKKAVKIISLALVVIIVGVMLASCAKTLSGTYTAGSVLGRSYTFSGNKVTLTVKLDLSILGSSTSEFKGTYEITKATDGSESITFTFEGDDKTYNGTYSFEQGKDDAGAFIVIAGDKLYKK